MHFEHALLCINAGKDVLVEKPFTINVEQTKIIKQKAEEKGVFCMEAMWTRFLPLIVQLKKSIVDKEVGEVRRIFGDICLGVTQEELGDDHRLVDVSQGGGVLLDIGIYPLTYPFHLLPNRPYQLSSLSTLMSTGADLITSLVLRYPKKSDGTTDVHAIITASLSGISSEINTLPTIRIECTGGEIRVFGPAWCPTGFTVLKDNPEGEPEVVKTVQAADLVDESMKDLRGMWYQADECAKCIRDGKKESEVMPLSESVKMMEAMDEARKLGGIVYPADIESIEIPTGV
jgi:predicted dehydrogenase